MAPRNDGDRLRVAWRALAGAGAGEGWRTIPIELTGPCHLLAGRHFPGNQEAILVGFRSVRMPPASHLPRGHGFRVEKVPREDVPVAADAWFSLSRQASGSLDMFATMAADIIGLLETCPHAGEDRLFQLFLGRIRAWQDFMERGRDGILGPEAEVGLVGELVVLKSLLDAQVPPIVALDTWQGPLDGLHDFQIGTGAIEVKATVSTGGFPATIGSLEQLDESLRRPLFLAGVRLALDGQGRVLPEFVADLRDRLGADPAAMGVFESRLVQAGFLQAFANVYTRRFSHACTVVLPVDERFPKLTRYNVGIAVRKARYELDLDLVDVADIGLDRALEQLGGI